MAQELYFENEHSGKRYKIVSLDREAGIITLIGKHNRPFTEKYDKERFQRMGYTLKQEDVSAQVSA